MRVTHLENIEISQLGQHVLGKDTVNLRQRALMTGFEAQRLEIAPDIEHRCEGPRGVLGLQTVDTRVYAVEFAIMDKYRF